jgi:tetratricopeptide (TPR) repeat protein
MKEAVAQMQALADDAAKFYREGKDREADAALDALLKKDREAGLISQFFLEVFAYNFQSLEDEKMLFAILEKNVELFPGSFTACDLLASLYSSRGKTELALKYFRKVLELDPGNRNAARRIKELGR